MARARRQARLAVIAIGVFLGAGASLTARGEVKARDAATLAVLLARIPHVARSESGIGAEERALAEALQAYGAAAVPELLSLLRSPDARIGRFVGYVLRDINGLEERDLDALIAARRRGDGWIPPAIAHIGTPRAIQFLVEELRAKAEVDTQLTWALVTAGERAAAPLADLFGAATPTSAQLARAVCRVFEGMGDRAAPAVEPLMAITSRRALPLANRRHAVDALGCIGPAARPAIATLRRLSASEPARFARATDEVLRAVGAPEAAPGLIAELRAHPSEDALRDLAFIGHDARAAGADVLALASNADWQLRAAAVRTLGFIGYDLAAGSLTALLGNGDDWRLVQAAAESLGRLRATTATVALQQVAADHWYPRVRDAAREALRVIGGTGRPEPRVGRRGFAALFFRYGGCCAGAPADEATPALRHSGDELHGGELR
ncbi:MAG: lyase HEAT-like repeat protein, partial [Myxococcales bacterium]|nr:lyase HEAT-like repeat protein [Myxococcales bacterium]